MTRGLLIGCDFSSSPTRRKPIVMAAGSAAQGRVLLASLERVASLDEFEEWLRRERAWIAAFDFPFGLPRELVVHLGWPEQWPALIRHYASLSRPEIRDIFAAFCDARPAGGKFAHRAADRPAGSSPSMKWVNPPVAYMLHAGVPRLLAAGVHFPCLHEDEEVYLCWKLGEKHIFYWHRMDEGFAGRKPLDSTTPDSDVSKPN